MGNEIEQVVRLLAVCVMILAIEYIYSRQKDD